MVKDIRKNAKIVDSFLKQYFKKQKNSNLISPMKYGILSGGKKIRSNIIINSSKTSNLNSFESCNIKKLWDAKYKYCGSFK